MGRRRRSGRNVPLRGGAPPAWPTHQSPPLSAHRGADDEGQPEFLRRDVLKAIGRRRRCDGLDRPNVDARPCDRHSADVGHRVRRLVMADGSGLSRYNYVSVTLLVDVLRHVWADDRHCAARSWRRCRSPGTTGRSSARMTDTAAAARAGQDRDHRNVRSLSGYCETADGRKIVFSHDREPLHRPERGDRCGDGEGVGKGFTGLNRYRLCRPNRAYRTYLRFPLAPRRRARCRSRRLLLATAP